MDVRYEMGNLVEVAITTTCAIRAGWEERVWLDQNRFLRLPGSAKQGDSAFNYKV